MGWRYSGFPRYVSKAEKIRKAEKARKALQKKGVSLEPVTVSGRVIAKSWWGKAWTDNLERYSDYENRLPRGRSYLRSEAVLDLKITKGTITALVAGSGTKPYKVAVNISPLPKKRLSALQKKSSASLDSMQLLLSGRLPEEIKNDFFRQGSGLFPTPKEIELKCSCPDWAEMCKHVAAALYGAAVRLDEKPELFFLLRGIDVNSFVGEAVRKEGRKLAKKAAGKTARTLAADDAQMEALFGISLETSDDTPVATTGKKRKKGVGTKQPAKDKKKKSLKKVPLKKVKTPSTKTNTVKKKVTAKKKTGAKKISRTSRKKSSRPGKKT